MVTNYNRNNLDVIAYNNCINNAINARVYAYSWYLDAVSENWGVLVLNNFEAVMPLTWNEKLFIKYIYPPVWTQQLGIFSKKTLSVEILEMFLNSIPKKFKKVTIQLNSHNFTERIHLQIRNNYILPLNNSYTNLYSAYNKNRKRDLQKANKTDFNIDENLGEDDFYKFYLKYSNKFQNTSSQIKNLKKLLSTKKGKFIAIEQNGVKVASLLYFEELNRITYLLPVASKLAKKIGFSTVIVDYLIKKYANTNFIFDFEGSMAYGTAKFYNSFGSTKELYFLYKKNRL